MSSGASSNTSDGSTLSFGTERTAARKALNSLVLCARITSDVPRMMDRGSIGSCTAIFNLSFVSRTLRSAYTVENEVYMSYAWAKNALVVAVTHIFVRIMQHRLVSPLGCT